MKQRTTRILSWLLALAMVFSMLPGMSLTAYADGGVCPFCRSSDIWYDEGGTDRWYCNDDTCDGQWGFETPAQSDSEPEPVADYTRVGNAYCAGDTLPRAYYYAADDAQGVLLTVNQAISSLGGCAVDVGDRVIRLAYGDSSYLYFRPIDWNRFYDSVSAVQIYEGGGTKDDPYKIRPQYTVSFNSNGGSTNPSSQQVWRGDKVTKPDDPTSESGDFAGWYNGNSAWDFNQNSVDYPITLTAHWNVPVTGVTLDKQSAELTVGGNTVALTATVEPNNATDKTVTWTSSDTTVATVENGVVTAVAAGVATITAKATNGTDTTEDDKTATCNVTVNAATPAATSYTLTFSANGNTVTKEVTLPHTFSCSYDDGNGELDSIIQQLYELGSGWFCSPTSPTASGSTSVTAGKSGYDQYITVSAPFEGTATVRGVYIPGDEGAEEFTYTLAITCQASGDTLAPVSYRVASVNAETHEVTFTDASCAEYTVVSADTTAFEDGKWYVVNDDVSVTNRIAVTGTANLILVDGKTLTATKGIKVTAGNTLNIYAQSEDKATMGTLTIAAVNDYNAGIGGDDGDAGGSVTIYGGNITASGGAAGAGIGGGYYYGNGGSVTIYGGNITARGGAAGASDYSGAGIGGGGYYGNGGDVTIYGGDVTATGGASNASDYGGAGIGGGAKGNGGTVTIYGGRVTANCSASEGTVISGIGRGEEGNSDGTLTVAATHKVYSHSAPITDDNKDSVDESLQGTGGEMDVTRNQYMLVEPGALHVPVSYRVASVNAETHEVTFTDASCAEYTVVSADTTAFEDGKWYVVNDNVSVTNRIAVTGTANLILVDGKTLTDRKGITVNSGNTLNIYGQSEGTGKLNARTSNVSDAVIGGVSGSAGGSIAIHGGTVVASGDSTYDGSSFGAGIGGGANGAGGNITIYGGTVSGKNSFAFSSSTSGAGIGGGSNGAGGTVTIYGGTVTGESKGNAGIGGNASGVQSTVTIYGGTVTGRSTYSHGIGDPGDSTVTIHGGTVTAINEYSSFGITGSGVIVDGGTLTAQGGGVGIEQNTPLTVAATHVAYSHTETITADNKSSAEAKQGTGNEVTITRKQYMLVEPGVLLAPVSYRVASVNAETHEVTFTDASCAEYTVVSADTTAFEDGKWYVVNDDVSVTNRIAVTGTANLILVDEKTLTASNGITVNSGNALNIYGQSEGTGKLNAGTSNVSNAVIGGVSGSAGGSITIHGGTVSASGGIANNGSDFGAGIGGGANGAGGNITIYGGTVKGTDSYARVGSTSGTGIGGGSNGAGGTVTIYGGTVTGDSGRNAGIGGNASGVQSTVTIYGGTVTGQSSYGHGIGDPGDSTVTIYGGTVTAINFSSGFGITGSGVIVNGGTLTAQGGGAGIEQNTPLTVAATHVAYSNTQAITADNKSSVEAKQGTGNELTITRKRYMLVEPGALHVHDFTYSVTGGTITATCVADGCKLTNPATLTLNAPTLTTYGQTGEGISAAATLTGLDDFNATTGLSATATDIRYVGRDGTTYTESATAPTDAGKYTTKITLSGVKTSEGENKSVTASVDYEIAWPDIYVAGNGTADSTGVWVHGQDWSAGNEADKMTCTDGVYTISYKKVPGGSYEFKFALNGTWEKSYGKQSTTTFKLGEWNDVGEYSGTDTNVAFLLTELTDIDITFNIVEMKAKVDVTPSHTHSFTYSATGAAITATCTVDGCTLDDGTDQHNHTTTLTLEKPTLTTYGQTGEGISAAATLTGLDDFNTATGKSVAATNIQYFSATKNGDTYTKGDSLSAAPTGAGHYLAEITLSGVKTAEGENKSVTASVGYTIAKADAAVTTAPATATNLTFNGNPQNLLTGEGTASGGTMQYALGQSGTAAPAEGWSDSSGVATATDAGTYYVWYKVKGDSNHNDTAPLCLTVEIAKADISPTVSVGSWSTGEGDHGIVVSGNTGAGKVTYTFAPKGSEDFSPDLPSLPGDYTVKAVIAETANYKGGTATADFTIETRPLKLEWSGTQFTYNGKAQAPTVKVTGVQQGDDVTVTVSGAKTNAGEYTATAVISGKDKERYTLLSEVSVRFVIRKANQTAPAAPVVTKETVNSITVKTVKGVEYSLDGRSWQTSGVFSKLKAGTKYTVRARRAETANYNPSPVVKAAAKTLSYSNLLSSGLKINASGRKIAVKWGKVPGATAYDIYVQYCSSSYTKKATATAKGYATSIVITKVNGRAINTAANYKVYVVARSGKTVLGKSPSLHGVASGRKNVYTDPKAITLSKTALTLNKGKTASIGAKLTLVNSKLRQLSDKHAPALRYVSSDTRIATVNAKGQVTAKAPGLCYIYVLARTGLTRIVTVSVK